MDNTARVWIAGFCNALNWNPGSSIMRGSDFINKTVQKICRLPPKKYKKFVQNIKYNIPALENYRLHGARCDVDTLLQVFVAKVLSKQMIHFDSIFNNDKLGLDENIYSGGITISRDCFPKSITCRVISMLNHILSDYYHGVTSNLEQTLKKGEEGYYMTTAQLLQHVACLNCYLRWWDFNYTDGDTNLRANDNSAATSSAAADGTSDPSTTAQNAPSTNPILPAICPTTIKREILKARREIQLQLQYHLGLSQIPPDELIFRIYITPVGEVTSITAILDGGAMDRKMACEIAASACLIPWTGVVDDDTIAKIGECLTKNSYHTRHPLTHQTIDYKMPESKVALIRRLMDFLKTEPTA